MIIPFPIDGKNKIQAIHVPVTTNQIIYIYIYIIYNITIIAPDPMTRGHVPNHQPDTAYFLVVQLRLTSLPINHSGKEIYDASNVLGDVQSPVTVDNATPLCRM